MSGEITSSQENEHPKMSELVKLIYEAAYKGDRDELMRLLELEAKPKVNSSRFNEVQTSESDQTSMMMHPQTAIYFAGGSVGFIVLATLISKNNTRFNNLALTCVKKYNSMLKARNESRQTPLHIAAIVGNQAAISKLIHGEPDHVVKALLREKDNSGEIPLHEAVRNNHQDVVDKLMSLDPKGAQVVNKHKLSPLYLAIFGRRTSIVETLLEKHPPLAYSRHPDGSLPVHVAALNGNTELVMFLMRKHPDSVKGIDIYRKNFLHKAAEKDNNKLITKLFDELDQDDEVTQFQRKKKDHEGIVGLINAMDIEGETPLHKAAKRGDKSVMEAIWQRLKEEDRKFLVQNHEGLTPFDLSMIQVRNTTKGMQGRIMEYVRRKNHCFSQEWFDDIMEPPYESTLDRIQVIGLGSVLITTVAFAVAFTVPGGFQDNGTPILGRRYFFRAFVVANTLAFIQAITSLFTLVLGALRETNNTDLRFATFTFRSAASCMVVAFGLGSYVMLQHVRRRIAILVLALTLLLGSPAAVFLIVVQQRLFSLASNGMTIFKKGFSKDWYSTVVLSFSKELLDPPFMLALYGIPLLLIFCLAIL